MTRFLAAVAAILLVVVVWLNVQRLQQQEQREAAEQRAQALQQQVDNVGAQRDQVAALLAGERKAQTELRTYHDALQTTLTASLQQIEELKHANQALRDWSAQSLPAAAQRLRNRPAVTGAAAFSQWLSSRNPLHPAGEQPAQ